MKKIVLTSLFFGSLLVSAQTNLRTCGFDETLEQQDRDLPGVRETFKKITQQLKANKGGNSNLQFAKQVNGVYEIPVVVHVIHPTGAALGSTYNKSDAQIQQWIDNANKMYAGTYPWPANGVPADFGQTAVFPIKLVLAKRTPSCESTNGILRYNGGTLTNYNTSGMSYGNNGTGATRTAIKNLAPHWDEKSYFNIYVISMFNGDSSPNSGLMGFAAFPNNLDANYESFMKSGVVTNSHDTTFAHEFGHAMGLYHTFQGGDYSAQSGTANYCPPSTGVCANDNDEVCDTERAGAAYFQFPPPSNSAINPCTNAPYQGVQYNMMNYNNSVAQKFTPGQGEKINELFMLIRSSLTSSLGATPLPTTPLVSPVSASCAPAGVTNSSISTSHLAGPTGVRLGNIDNSTAATWAGDTSFYNDYTTKLCSTKAYTELVVNQAQTIEVDFLKTLAIDQSIRVWIDYNNNGQFETAELVAQGNNVAAGAGGYGTFTASFTPPSTAVMNTALRMRVIADYSSNITACGTLAYGQAEDYAVKLMNTLGTSEISSDKDIFAVYPNPAKEGDGFFIKTKDAKNISVVVSDMSGRLVGKPSVNKEDNDTFKVNQNLSKGVYMIQVSNGKETKSSKLIVK